MKIIRLLPKYSNQIIKLFLVIIFINFTYSGFSQVCWSFQDIITVDGSCTDQINNNLLNANQIIQARDQFDFKTGAHIIAAPNHYFDAKTDHSIIAQDVSFEPSIVNGKSRQLDKNNFAPGGIGGTINISATGASTYQLPIQVSPGTNGMQPNLGIVYSSQSGNGILGYGWNISGLSVITRVNKNQYYDNTTAGITLNNVTDVFALDGQRLIPNANASNTFSPENDPYTYVTFDGNKFTVTSKDGIVMEFGNNYNSNNSQFITSGTSVPFAYALDKTTDTNGNYVEYIYSGSSTTGEYHISTIYYTGNSISGAKPYNSILFFYDKKPDFNSQYIAGGKLNSSAILTGIKIFAEATLSKDYKFSYFNDQFTFSYLNQISLTADGITNNPTIINWNSLPDYKTTTSDANSTLGRLFSSKLYFGDFNGDGLTDIARWNDHYNDVTISLALPGGGYSSGYDIYPNNYPSGHPHNTSDTNYKYVNSDTNSNFSIEVVDWDNDGKSDIIVHYIDELYQEVYPIVGTYLDHINTFDYDIVNVYSFDGTSFNGYNSRNVICGVNHPDLIANTNIIVGTYKYYYADFNNDGNVDRLVVRSGTVVDCEGITLSSIPSIINVDNVQIVDFNGNGLAEFLTTDKFGNSESFEYNGSTFVPVLHGSNNSTIQLSNKSQDIIPGDFNGDGKTDFLTYLNKKWIIWYSDGISPFLNNQVNLGLSNSLFLVPPPSQSGQYDSLRITWNGKVPQIAYYKTPVSFSVTDINNDGISDIIYADGGQVEGLIFNANGKAFQQIANSLSSVYVSNMTGVALYAIDINNDGQKEIIYGNDDYPFANGVAGAAVHDSYKIISFPTRLDQGFYVNSITDGTNVDAAITYKQTQTYLSGQRNFPLAPIKGSMFLASQITKRDLNTNTILSTSKYSFQDGMVHLVGKGFLGFSKIITTDSIPNTVSTTNYSFTINDDLGNTCYYPWASSQSVSRGGINISSRTNTIIAKGGSFTNKLFLPVPVSSISVDKLTGITSTSSLVTFDVSTGRVTDQKTITSDGWSMESKPTFDIISGNKSRLSKMVSTRKLSTAPDTYTSTTTYAYNSSFPFRITSQTAQNKIITTSSGFDGYGNPTQTTVSLVDGTSPPRKSSCTFDQYDRFIVSLTDVTNLTSQSSYRNTDGAVLSKTDSNNLTSKYSYSSGGNANTTTVTLPDGNVSTSTQSWDASGTALIVSSNTITNGSTQTSYINAAGQTKKETTNGALNGAILTKTYTYNADGSQNTFTDPTGNITTYQYYPEGRLKSVIGLNLNTTYSYSGNSSTVTDAILHQTKTTYTDATGNITNIVANTGNLIYTYNSAGKPLTINASGGMTSMTYDPLTLDQLALTDADAGVTTYTYNGFGQLLTQTDALNTLTTNKYDDFGRIISTINTANSLATPSIPATSTSYVYSTTNGSLGRLQSTTRDKITETYTYDGLSRISAISTSTTGLWPDGTQLPDQTITYNGKGQKSSITYPSGLTANYFYDVVGNLTQIKNAADNTKIWSGDVIDLTTGRWTQFSLGNGLITKFGYDPTTLMLNSIKTGTSTNSTSIQNLGFTFNTAGQLMGRSDGSLSETFSYDGMNRLRTEQVGNGLVSSTNYFTNGNIDNTSLTGTYSYDPNHIHGVSNVAPPVGVTAPNALQTLSNYNVENKTLSIANQNTGYRDDFTYGVDGNRFRMDFKTYSGSLLMSKVYLGNSEFGYNSTGTLIYKRTIIEAPTGVCAIYQDSGSIKTIYYVHTDYLGSWLGITDKTGAINNRYSYDAWGRPRDPSTWALKAIDLATALTSSSLYSMQPRFDRGYTGHEQMCGFGLINMNGRMYDPYLQRFLSPDNVVQSPGDAQSYNRYAYCMNNPLMYTDPSGYSWLSHFCGWVGENWKPIVTTVAAIGAAILTVATMGAASPLLIATLAGASAGFTSGCLGTALNGGNLGQCLGAGLVQGAIGAASGLVGAGIGSGVNSLLAGGSFLSGLTGTATRIATGFCSGFVTGAAGGFAGSFVAGFASAALKPGSSFGDMLSAGWKVGWKGAIAGGAIGSITGGIDAVKNDRNFWNGAPKQHGIFSVNNGTASFIDENNYKNANIQTREHYAIQLQDNSNVSLDGVHLTIDMQDGMDGLDYVKIQQYSNGGDGSFFNHQFTLTVWDTDVNKITIAGWRYESNPIHSLKDLFYSRKL